MTMRRKKNESVPLHDRIRPIDRATLRAKPPAWMVNQFFFIEAFLRGATARNAYEKGGTQAVMEKLREQGIPDQDPLSATHHTLVQDPPPVPKELRDAQARGGTLRYEDGIKLIDLAATATRPRNYAIKVGQRYIHGMSDGMKECLLYLKSGNPKYLCLCIDVTQPFDKIETHVGALLRERRRQVKTLAGPPPPVSHFERQNKITFQDVKNWVGHLMCYDLHRHHNRTLAEAWNAVHGEHVNAAANANTAVRRVKHIIEWADKGWERWPPPKIK